MSARKLLSPLSQSKHTDKNTNKFVQGFQRLHVSEDNYKLVSFDVTVFTKLPLDYSIDVILRRIYTYTHIHTHTHTHTQRERENETNRTKLKNLLILCTKNVHFSLNGQLYLQKDGIAMGSPLAPVMAGIFMVELGRKVLPMLLQYIKGKKRYADDTISYVKVDCTEHVLCIESFPCKYFFYL